VKKTSGVKIYLFVLLGIIVAGFISLVCYVYAWDGAYLGVKCGGVSLANMTAEEAVAAIRDVLPEDYKNKKINLSFDGHGKEIALSEFGVNYDLSQTVDEAMAYGKEGNVFQRLKKAAGALLMGYDHKLSFAYDKDALESKVSDMLKDVGTPVIEYSYEVSDGKFYIINGTPGNMPDGAFVSSEILNAVGLCDFDKELVFEKQTREPKEINVDELYKELNKEAKDAEYVLSGGEVTVVPHQYKVVFDKGEAKKIISENTGAGKKYEIPAEVEEPEFLEKDAKSRLFSQTLGSYKSNYNQGDVSRSSNVSLAAKLVNGTVIMPGGEFSYNTVVGKRTAEAGFKVAHVYMNNEVVDGIGGGICQVSSTLYCAVLYANLQVTERVNHQLSVSYVPLGQDATVDYGNIDFRFKNNTGYPLRVLTYASGGVMYASIEGYKEVSEKVEITNERVSVIPPKVVEEEDPELPFGERKEGEEGNVGYVVETYKTVTANGQSKKTFVSRSTYASGKTIVKVGTGPTPSPSAEPAAGDEIEEDTGLTEETETPTPTPSGEIEE